MKKLVNICALIILSASSLFAQAAGSQFDLHPMHWARFWARGLFDRNLIYCPVWNIGNVTDSGVDPGDDMQWPGSEGLSFVDAAVFYIGALVYDMSAYEGQQVPETWDGSDIYIVSDAYNTHVSQAVPWAQLSKDKTHQQKWAPIPGFFNDGAYGYIYGINEDTDGDGELSPAEDINLNGILDYNLEPPESILKSMAISTDKRTWPEYWPGGTYVGDEREFFGRPPRTVEAGERKGKWNGEFKAGTISDQETLYWMDDHENDHWNDYKQGRYWPMKNSDGTPDTTPWADGGIAGAGVEVEARTYAWFHPLAEDLLVSVYRVRNYSDYTLKRVVTGMWANANIAGKGDYNLASYIIADFDYEGSGGRLDFDILYQWHQFPDQLSTYKKVGTFGFAFLESPGIPYNGLDDDADGLVDEAMDDGIDNDGDWLPYADIGIDKKGPGDEGYVGPDGDGTENNGRWDTEDANLNGALDPGEDTNKNDKLDFEPIRNDRGTDGIGPDENGWPGPDTDGTEANGAMDLGEPNFDKTDIDEADQAGLKHVYVYENNKDLKDDKAFWEKYLAKDDVDIEETDEDIVFTFGARNVQLDIDVWRRFTIAMIMGEDEADAIRNKATMQNIYDENYQFLTPPLQPTLVSNTTNRKVQLYWDTDAEASKDPFFGEDFNGYRLYKSTDPKFLDVKTITDAFGNILLFEPLEIWDKDDGLMGVHPIPFPNLGVHYDMGNDSGLKHAYTDTVVENGRTYYYALTAIDAGNDDDFYERKLVTEDYPMQAMPSESPFNITVNKLGEVVYRDRNTAVVIPTEPAAGFTEPHIDSTLIKHNSGWARGGKMNIEVFNKNHANLGNVYELQFEDDHWLDSLTNKFEWGGTTGIRCLNVTTGDTMFDFQYDTPYYFKEEAYKEIEQGFFEGVHYDLSFPIDTDVRYHGIEIVKTNADGRKTNEWKRWATDTESNLRVEEIDLDNSDATIALPFDFEIRVEEDMGADTSIAIPPLIKAYPLNFTTWNVTDPNNPIQMDVVVRYDKDSRLELPQEMFGQLWDSTRVILKLPNKKETGWLSSWTVEFYKNRFDSLKPVIAPAPGDIYRFKTTRNPSRHDRFQFTIDGGTWDEDKAKIEMRDIYVVPDPYVVSSSYESIYELAGYSQRRVDFVNLPPQCTIKIFTASGKLVRTLDHNEANDFGRHSWDLTTEDGPEVAFGMYFFVVESKALGTTRGKFAIIK